MLKLILSITSLIFLTGGIASCSLLPDALPTTTPIPTTISSAYCDHILEAVKSLPRQPEVSESAYMDFLKGLADGKIEGFDVNSYFTVLPHLAMKPGDTLDYVYLLEDMGGEPVLYARPIGQPPHTTYSEYEKAKYPSEFPGWPELQHGFMDSVQIDDTVNGYFEAIVLRKMGSQFYQFWHAGYNDAAIICSQAGLEKLISEYAGSDLQLPVEIQQKARNLDFTPVVEIGNDRVLVKLVSFTAWGGFISESYTISRNFPRKIQNGGEETLVQYDCGIVY